MALPYLSAGQTAVVTGAASGIGLAACKHFASLGMNVCMNDVRAEALERAAGEVAALAPDGRGAVLAIACDVGKQEDVASLCKNVFERFGSVGFLMNNAAARVAGGNKDGLENWHQTMDVNFWGPVYAERAFLPRLLEQDIPSAIVNTGSKQGITNPPGNLIYNVTKSALKTYTEGLQHRLRNLDGCKTSAHLLIPGWTTTGNADPKPGAWLPMQVIDFMIAALERGTFYILCPDNEVTAEMDCARMIWAVGDISEDRPPLSRWHPDWADKFKAQ